METLIRSLTFFICGYMIVAIPYAQSDQNLWGLAAIMNEPAAVPLILLSVMPWLQAFNLLLCLVYLRVVPASERLFLPYFNSDNGNPSLDFPLEAMTAGLTLGLPVAGFAYWWIAFHQRVAWRGADGAAVSLYDWSVPVTNLLWHANAFKYGLRPGDATHAGVSFVPFWQPVLVMGGGTVLAVGLTIISAREVLRRWPIRRRMVRP